MLFIVLKKFPNDRFRSSRLNLEETQLPSLLVYNDYLEQVEDINSELLKVVDPTAFEAALEYYVRQIISFLSRNNAIIGHESASAEAQLATQTESPRQRAMAKEEDEQERVGREDGRREASDKHAISNGNADQIMREGEKVEYKKSTARRKPGAGEKARKAQTDSILSAGTAMKGAAAGELGFQLRGLKPVVETAPEKPYDPFGGLSMHREYYEPQEHIDHPWLDKARTDPVITAGGYDLKEYYARTLLEAFAGLACFIAEEMAPRDGGEDGNGDGEGISSV